MIRMILVVAAVSLLFSCKKEVTSANYLPGKWNLTKTELYEKGVLKASSVAEDERVVYYFSSCETTYESACDMYIEEDGEVQMYTYTYDAMNYELQLNGSSTFFVERISAIELMLVRHYDDYTSMYQFERGE